MLITFMPKDAAKALCITLIEYDAETKEHTVDSDFIQALLPLCRDSVSKPDRSETDVGMHLVALRGYPRNLNSKLQHKTLHSVRSSAVSALKIPMDINLM